MNRKEFVKTTEEISADMQLTTCGLPQGPILGPLFILLYVNDLPKSSQALDIIMFADNTNIFYKHKNISNLFSNINDEYIEVSGCLKSNKLSVNFGKAKNSLFIKLGDQMICH